MSSTFDLERYWSESATILVRMKRFKKATLKYRKKLGINKNGFSKEMALEWYKALFNHEDFDIKKRFAFESSQIFLPPNKFVIETIEQFANEFNLDERWYIGLLYYLMSDKGSLDAPYGGIDIQVQVNDSKLPPDQQVVTKLSIEINNDTSQEEIEDIWKTIEYYQAKMKSQTPKRRKNIDNIKKYIQVRELEDGKKTQQEIADENQKLGFKTATDVANFKKEIEKRFDPMQ